ncbi:MAG: rRNA maturation RNAse YbeY [Opitutaceae bacterium]|nr:rRNA maturation RNAse YbeY [Opitutaceae bacterium]
MTRNVVITNRHPRLRLDRRAIARAIALLDERFEMLPGDLAHLSLRRPRLAELNSKIKNRKSRIPGLCPSGELSLVFLTDPALAQIHADFMDDPTATDVITFEGDAAAGLAGEICVSADTAWQYVEGPAPAGPRPGRSPALQKKQSQSAFSAELTLYLVHGWLHLVGYDDLQPAKKRRMRAAEARAMKLLRTAESVPEFKLL